MKKKFRKLSSLAVAFALVFALALPAFAADISAEDAKAIALKDAGYSQSEVLYLRAEADYDDGVKYFDVSFAVKNADGSYQEYDYDVAASDGRILEKDADREFVRLPQASVSEAPAPEVKASAPAQSADIGQEAAKSAALNYFSLSSEEVKFLKVRAEYDDGVKVYDVEFCKPYDVKYSCDVVASDGSVVDADKDVARDIFDKFELFFEVFFSQLLNR